MRNLPSYLEAVIVDLDGLLVDSEPLQFRAYQKAFLAHGIDLRRRDWSEWHEQGASAKAWLEHIRRDVDPEAIRAAKKSIYDRLVASELVLKPGARELIADLAANGMRLCIASGSRIESIEACLRRFDLRVYFEGLYSATTTARKKPYPDVSNLAMAEMGLTPDNVVVIEDSPVGLRAALAANLRCVKAIREVSECPRGCRHP